MTARSLMDHPILALKKMKIHKHQQKLLRNSPPTCRPYLKDSFDRNLGITIEDVRLGDFIDMIDEMAAEKPEKSKKPDKKGGKTKEKNSGAKASRAVKNNKDKDFNKMRMNKQEHLGKPLKNKSLGKTAKDKQNG